MQPIVGFPLYSEFLSAARSNKRQQLTSAAKQGTIAFAHAASDIRYRDLAPCAGTHFARSLSATPLGGHRLGGEVELVAFRWTTHRTTRSIGCWRSLPSSVSIRCGWIRSTTRSATSRGLRHCWRSTPSGEWGSSSLAVPVSASVVPAVNPDGELCVAAAA